MTLFDLVPHRPTSIVLDHASNVMTIAAASDDALVDRSRRGDASAFGLLVQRYQDAVYSLCYHLCGDRTEAEDLAQDAVVRFHGQLARFSPRTPLWPWLRRLTMNSALNGMRGRRRHRGGPSLDDDLLGLDVPVDAHGAPLGRDAGAGRSWHGPDDVRIDLERHLLALSPGDRAVLVLRYLEDLTYAEIAALLAVPESTVETRLFRARMRLGSIYRAQDRSDGKVQHATTPSK